MGTEHPDTEGMHRLFGDALDDVDLTGDVVPAVLTGYRRRVKTRRYQSAGVALAVLATAGAAVSTLPRGGDAVKVTPATAPANQNTNYCGHRQWADVSPLSPNTTRPLAADPRVAADQANCEAFQTAVRAVFPAARIVPVFTADLGLDPRVDQALLKQVDADEYTNADQWSADIAKHFGSELKYLAVHPEDPANVYMPDAYELVTAAGRELVDAGIVAPLAVGHPEPIMGVIDSHDCANVPNALAGKSHCTPVGADGGWHGALWNVPADGPFPPRLTGVMVDSRGKNVGLWGGGYDYQAWYHEGTYEKGTGWPLPGDTWINRWTGQTFHGGNPPVVHALTEAQWKQLLDSPTFQTFADGYLTYVDKRSPKDPASSSTHSH